MVYIRSSGKQNWLLPPNIEELIPTDHVCYLVEALVNSMDFTPFDKKYEGLGRPAYHPGILLKLLVMGVLDRIRSSRKLARQARENIVYMYLAEKLAPDFRTINDFRKQNPGLVKEAFKHTIILAKQHGVLDLSCLATDGTKIKANSANKHNLTREELKFLLRFVDVELVEWEKQDEIEDEQFGNLRGSDQLPDKSRKKIQKIVKRYIDKLKKKEGGKRGESFREEIKEKLEKAQQEVEKHNLKKVSLTDPESRFMKNKSKRIEFSYNSQITADKRGFIIASDVCQDYNDVKQLCPQIIQTEENLGILPGNIPWNFDNGYFDGENLAFTESKKIDAHIAPQKASQNPFSADKFIFNRKKNEYVCPAGQPVTFLGKRYDKPRKESYFIYRAHGCLQCSHQKSCTQSKSGVRYLKADLHQQLARAMYAKMETGKAQEIYKLRAQTVEPAIGDIKYNKGLVQFLTRGLETVKTEFDLACIAHNLRKIWIQIQKPEKTDQMTAQALPACAQ